MAQPTVARVRGLTVDVRPRRRPRHRSRRPPRHRQDHAADRPIFAYMRVHPIAKWIAMVMVLQIHTVRIQTEILVFMAQPAVARVRGLTVDVRPRPRHMDDSKFHFAAPLEFSTYAYSSNLCVQL